MKINPNLPNWQLVIQTVEALNGSASTSEIKQYFLEHFLPEKRANNVPYDSKSIAVNSPSRIHYSGGKQPRRTDTNNQYDRLFINSNKKFEIYDCAKHGVWEIAKNNEGTLYVKQVSEPNSELTQDVEQETPNNTNIQSFETSQFAMESHLRDYLAQNLHSIKGVQTTLELFTDETDIPGVEYRTEAGIIDILARGNDNSFYVLELKLGRGPDAVIGQILRYMGWVRTHLATPSQKVYGIIVTNKTTDKLKYAASEVPTIHLMEYELSFSLQHVEPIETS